MIFENEIHGILANNDEANAMFFFSYGKFQTDCVAETAAKPRPPRCGNDASPAGSTFALGAESISGGVGVTASQSTILDGSFPTDRYLWNVYSNGTNGTIPATSQPALNFMSEWGFICKQDSAVDSNSGGLVRVGDPGCHHEQRVLPADLGRPSTPPMWTATPTSPTRATPSWTRSSQTGSPSSAQGLLQGVHHGW